MEHLVESHMGGRYISNLDPDIIEEYCEQCGDSDRIMLSWEEGKMMETLISHFSSLKMSQEKLEADKNDDLASIEELTDSLTYAFDEDRYLINELFGDKSITEEERILLLKQVSKTQKEQFKLLKSVFNTNSFVRLKNKNNRNDK